MQNINELTDFYMWMVKNNYNHNIKKRVEKKAEIYLNQKQITGFQKRLKESIEHERYLEEQLRKRPFEVKIKADTVDTGNHPNLTNLIIQKLKDKERFACKIRIEEERLWVLPIGYIDSCNANFDCEEQGQIFAGVLDNDPLNDKLEFNDLIQFQSCDVFEIRTIS